jgi:hypothetical protein
MVTLRELLATLVRRQRNCAIPHPLRAWPLAANIGGGIVTSNWPFRMKLH